MVIKLYLDDVRKTPEGFTHSAYTAQHAITYLKTGCVEFISLDHDLGDDCEFCTVRDTKGRYQGACCIQSVCSCTCHQTGYDVAKWIEEAVHFNLIAMPKWACHSANPAGKRNIEATMQSAERISNVRHNRAG